MQQIESDLINEFEAELQKELAKIQTNIVPSAESPSLEEFWKKFLTEEFPTGQINKTLEKNFAIYICQNRLNIEDIKGVYSKNKWSYHGLVGWIKKVNYGELKNFNIKELLQWANENKQDLVPLLEKAKAELSEEQLPILPIDELDNLPEQENVWLCRRLIRPKSICCLSGKRSTLKTWLSLNLAVCISSQLPFLDKFETEPCNVLFLDGESNKAELKKRKNLVKTFLELKKINNFFVLSEHYLKMDSEKGLAQLERQIKKLNIRLVIADSYRRFISFDENDATKTSQFLNDLVRPVCNRCGVSFLFIHHQKKGESEGDDMDTIRGSSDFVNLMDSILQVKRKGNKLTIKQTKNKFGIEVPAFNIELQTDEKAFFGFKFLGLDETLDIVCAKVILKWAPKSFTYTKALEFVEEKNFRPTTFKNALKELESRNLIQKGEGSKSPYTVISKIWAGEQI